MQRKSFPEGLSASLLTDNFSAQCQQLEQTGSSTAHVGHWIIHGRGWAKPSKDMRNIQLHLTHPASHVWNQPAPHPHCSWLYSYQRNRILPYKEALVGLDKEYLLLMVWTQKVLTWIKLIACHSLPLFSLLKIAIIRCLSRHGSSCHFALRKLKNSPRGGTSSFWHLIQAMPSALPDK